MDDAGLFQPSQECLVEIAIYHIGRFVEDEAPDIDFGGNILFGRDFCGDIGCVRGTDFFSQFEVCRRDFDFDVADLDQNATGVVGGRENRAFFAKSSVKDQVSWMEFCGSAFLFGCFQCLR